jgi:prepilin-type N-terminal cleavage/methylation domain-containing protein/prepilin-type processing-associated H-X9-DG protein
MVMPTIRRTRGFTLIELLVVIAIIAILAAMLFPVFARARESARKIQCLSNVKNIAMAMQMYLTDYDALPPREHRPEVLDFFGGDTWCSYLANPFMRTPVILDEYVKNRDVWRCPSAAMDFGATFIVPDYPPRGWFGYVEDNWNSAGDVGVWGSQMPVCFYFWPPGWGGSVTDSVRQQAWANYTGGSGVSTELGSKSGVFAQGIIANVGETNAGMKTSEVNDPAWYVACGDGGFDNRQFTADKLAYPGICRLGMSWCCGADWQNCTWTEVCGAPNDGSFLTDPETRKRHARHLGGVNIGFLDGHAQWFNSEYVLSESPRFKLGCTDGPVVQGKFQGILPFGPTVAADGSNPCGVPLLY